MPPFVAEIAVVPLAMTDKIVFGEKNMQQNKASRSLETALVIPSSSYDDQDTNQVRLDLERSPISS
ncbi:unnamed protein product [Rhodiola kirilowii]